MCITLLAADLHPQNSQSVVLYDFDSIALADLEANPTNRPGVMSQSGSWDGSSQSLREASVEVPDESMAVAKSPDEAPCELPFTPTLWPEKL